MARLKDFKGIEGRDFFEQDRGLQTLLEGLMAADVKEGIFASLHDCALRVSGEWNTLAVEAGRPENLPRLIKEDRVGNPVERVQLSAHAQKLRREVAQFGVLTDTRNEVHRFSMVYLLAHNGEASLMCGISCTDGLLRVLDAKASRALRDRYRDLVASVETPFAGAQFVTEQVGGSDVGAIEGVAERTGEGTWAITGEKWFCSNPTEYFVVAARPSTAPDGTRGVGLYFVPRVLPDGTVNSLRFRRLKDKVGTRSLPTAEIDLDGAVGFSIGHPREGFRNLMRYVINTSRLHNAANALGVMHRAFLEARNYAHQREAFGERIIAYPMIQETLVSLLATLWRERVVFFRLVSLIDEHGLVPEDKDQAMWQRCLTNISKYRTAVDLTAYVRDAMLILGGNGTIEDFTVLPRLLRDALIIETWEGSHNTLVLQLLRDMRRFDFQVLWQEEIMEVLARWPDEFMPFTRARLGAAFRHLQTLLHAKLNDQRWGLIHARRLVDSLGGVLSIAWMADMAIRNTDTDSTAALLTAMASDRLWSTNADRFQARLPNRLAEVAIRLIDEEVVPPPAWIREV
jgi:alkylation response protein AidB-like acyl-CoA dehydrogenase